MSSFFYVLLHTTFFYFNTAFVFGTIFICCVSFSPLYKLFNVLWVNNLICIMFHETFTECNQQDATFLNLSTSLRRSTCFRRFLRPSSGAQNCTYSVRYLSGQYLTLYVQFWAPDDEQKNCLRHVQRLTEINKWRNVASCWLYSVNILAMQGPMNVKFHEMCFY